MKRFSAILLTALPLFAQTLTLSGPATARPGATVTVNLSVAASGSAALQWAVGLPTGYTATVVAGAAATGKDLSCTVSNAFCLLVGQNATVIGNGVVAVYSLRVPATASGTAALPLGNLLGASAEGNPVTITSGPAYSLQILATEDLNGDGTVTAADVTLMTTQAIASQTTPSACINDLNSDGRCDVLDVFQVVLKSLGLI